MRRWIESDLCKIGLEDFIVCKIGLEDFIEPDLDLKKNINFSVFSQKIELVPDLTEFP